MWVDMRRSWPRGDQQPAMLRAPEPVQQSSQQQARAPAWLLPGGQKRETQLGKLWAPLQLKPRQTVDTGVDGPEVPGRQSGQGRPSSFTKVSLPPGGLLSQLALTWAPAAHCVF